MRFVTIELNSGYVWWVGDADDAVDACNRSDAETGNLHPGKWERISASEIRSTAGGYAVHSVPDGYEVYDGRDQSAIDAAKAMPLAGYFRRIAED